MLMVIWSMSKLKYKSPVWYSPLHRLTSRSCRGLRPLTKAFSGQKRAFNAVCAYFVPFLVFGSSLRNVQY